MKTLLLIALTLVASVCMAQRKHKPHYRYWQYEVSFWTNDCHSNSTGWCTTIGPLNYDQIYAKIKRWISPNKLELIEVTSIREVSKYSMKSVGEAFNCPAPIIFRIDTSNFIYHIENNEHGLGWPPKTIKPTSNIFSRGHFKPQLE